MTAVISHLSITSCISEACRPLRPWLECHLFHKASLIPLIPASRRLPGAPSHVPQFSRGDSFHPLDLKGRAEPLSSPTPAGTVHPWRPRSQCLLNAWTCIKHS